MKMEKLSLERGETALVIGPSRIRVKTGNLETFGKLLGAGESIIVGKYRAVPIEAVNDHVEVVIELGRGGKVEFRENIGTSIWRKELAKFDFKGDIMIVGEDDSGKTGLTTFLINILVSKGMRVGVIDADPGQGDLCVPTMIAAGEVTEQISTLSDIKPKFSFFIGKTSPVGLEKRVEEGVKELYDKLRRDLCEKIVINLHGWIGDDRAMDHVLRVQKLVDVKNVMIIRSKQALPIERVQLEPNIRKIYVTKPNTYRRTFKSRRKIRERKFRRYFEFERIEKMVVKHGEIPIKGSNLFFGQTLDKGVVSSILKAGRIPISVGETIYGEEINGRYNVLKINRRSESPLTFAPLSILDTRINLYFAGKQFGLVCGIKDQSGNWFLGKTLTVNIKLKKWIFLVPKSLKEPAEITVGRLVLDMANCERSTLPSDFFS